MIYDNNYDVETNTKIFVGNVPFQCEENEFKQCFKDVPGFITAEIVNRHNSLYSRGFGFVTVKTPEDAKNLIQRNDIKLKDRILRFTEYNFQNKKIPKQLEKNYLFVKNIPKNMTRDELKNIFSKKGIIGACFINTNIRTGESKGNAIIEIKNCEIFENLIAKKTIEAENGYIFEISKWRNKIKTKSFIKQNIYKRDNIDSKDVYRIAFNAGVNAGRLEVLRRLEVQTHV